MPCRPDADPAAVRPVHLASHTDLDGFRRAARQLLAELAPPHTVEWHTADALHGDLFGTAGSGDLFDPGNGIGGEGPPDTGHASRPGLPAPSVPAAFLTLCRSVVLHRDPGRFGLLYRLLWRLQCEPGLRHDPLDADWTQAQHLARAVRRDMHKMTAFVRFRPIETPVDDGPGGTDAGTPAGPLHVAWFEPDHHIVEAIAPFFVRRFTHMRWALLTPQRCVRWDGRVLHWGPGAQRDQAPAADAGEALWLTYYAHIFNPARLKLKMMQKEMPRRYWKNLPEARLITPLVAAAAQRSHRMVEQVPSAPLRRLPLPPPRPGATSPTGDAAASNAPPATLGALNQAVERCRACPIGAHATQAVCGEGPVGARLMLVGEQPGEMEDLRGLPFAGPAGQLLDRALAQLGWPRDRLYVTNAVKHFKFELRGLRRIHKTPAQQEAAACLDWLEHEMALVRPGAVVALGATAARSLLGRPVAVMRERGQWQQREDGLRVLVTLHPSALLRADPRARDAAFTAWLDDLRQASSALGDHVRPPPADVQQTARVSARP